MDRVNVRYVGFESVALASGQGQPSPARVSPGDVFSVEPVWAGRYVESPAFELVDAGAELPPWPLGPSDVPPAEELRGEALESALSDLGLSHTGTADDKRARIADAQQGNAPSTGEDA